MNSMTGYAYQESTTEKSTVSVEIKSYNSRFLDLSVSLPPYASRLENFFREKCTAAVQRGKMDVCIKVREKDMPVTVEANSAAAKAYYDAIAKIAGSLGRSAADIPFGFILAQDGVLTPQKDFDPAYYQALIEPVFNRALTAFLADRSREGKNLEKDLLHSLSRIEAAAAVFSEWQPKMEQLFKDSIKKRFAELLGDAVDEQRVMQETAAMLMKYTINEEIVRLHSHISALKHEMTENPVPGRKIDFICQELNREINTIGSKNQIVEVGQSVIAAKDALENIREQARNIE